MLAVLCNECGAQGPLSLGNDRTQAIHSWNQRWSEPPAGKGLPGFRPLKLGAATLDSVSVRLVCEAAKLRCGLTCRQLDYFRAVARSDQRFFVPRHQVGATFEPLRSVIGCLNLAACLVVQLRLYCIRILTSIIRPSRKHRTPRVRRMFAGEIEGAPIELLDGFACDV